MNDDPDYGWNGMKGVKFFNITCDVCYVIIFALANAVNIVNNIKSLFLSSVSSLLNKVNGLSNSDHDL